MPTQPYRVVAVKRSKGSKHPVPVYVSVMARNKRDAMNKVRAQDPSKLYTFRSIEAVR